MSIRKTAFIIGTVLLLGASHQTAHGFALGGPALGWQTEPLGFNRLGASITGGFALQYTPQNLGEEYRINIPTIYYTCDASFLDYFGARGMQEVDKAIKHFNDLPDFSSMSADLSEFPQDTTRENFKASALQLTDLKSFVMNTIIQQMGLVAPEIHVWDVRSRALLPNQSCPLYEFFVIQRNFDPVTWEPSSYVNGTLYTFQWIIQCSPAPDFSYPDTFPADPLSFGFQSLAGANILLGTYVSGLTRDDIGGLRYLYRPDNYNVEQLPPDVFLGAGGGGGSPFAPVVTNAAGTTGDTTALRTGLNKVRFEKRNYDSLLGNFFEGFTNSFTVQVVTNGSIFSQGFSRAVLQPDLVFSAGSLPVALPNTFNVFSATIPQFASLNGTGEPINGPGTLVVGNSRGPISLTLQKIGPTFYAQTPSFLNEEAFTPVWRWGSFDGTTNEPVLYPSGASIKNLEQQVLGSQ